MKFDCSRYCRKLGRDECRFQAVLPVRHIITSHTTKCEIEIRSKEAFCEAVKARGGTVIGEGKHRLYSSTEEGLAVKLPGWSYPIVLTAEGLAYDNYHGNWGKQEDLDNLIGEYALEAARERATQLGWLSQEVGGELVIYHPSGGQVKVTKEGVCSSSGFVGCGCDEALEIERALGSEIVRENTSEYYAERARITEGEG